MTLLHTFPITPEVAALRRRHREFFVDVAEQAAVAFGRGGGRPAPFSEQAAWIELLDAEMDNLRAAFEAAVDDLDPEPDAAARLVTALLPYLFKRRKFEEGLRWCDRILAAEPLAPERRAAVTISAAQLELGAGNYERSAALIDRGLELARSTDQAASLWTAFGTAVEVYGTVGRYSERDAVAEEYVEACRRSGDSAALARALVTRAVTYAFMGRVQDARNALAEAVTATRSLPDDAVLVECGVSLTSAYARIEDLATATATAEAALAAAREAGRPDQGSTLVYMLGHLRMVAGDTAAAVVAYRDAAVLYADADEAAGVGWALEGEARALVVEGDLDEAARLLSTVLQTARALPARGADDHWLEAAALASIAELEVLRGDLASARRLLEEAVEVPVLEASIFPITVRAALASVAQQEGDHSSATRWHEAAAEAAARWRGGDEPTAPELLHRGLARRSAGDHGAAAVLLQEAINLARSGEPTAVQSLLVEIGKAALERGDVGAARSAADEALARAEAGAGARAMAEAALLRAEVAIADDDPETAAACIRRFERHHLLVPSGFLAWGPLGSPTSLERLDAVQANIGRMSK